MKLGSAGTPLFGWEAWLTPRYTPLPDKSYHVKFGSSARKGVRIGLNRREPPKLGSAGAMPPSGRGVADPLKSRPSPVCYHSRFGSSVTKGACVNRWEPQNWEALGPRLLWAGAWLTPKNKPLRPIRVTTSNLVVLRQRVHT